VKKKIKLVGEVLTAKEPPTATVSADEMGSILE
jgi:hypothetical protein